MDIIRQLVEIPSVKGKPEQSAPFGAEPRRALDKMLEICREHGFVTGCHDNVMGTADYAPSGKVGLGILCHLDVVPAEPLNWSCPPFQLTRRDGKLFGRGVIDDKGPCAASLMALYCIKELGIPLKKGVRLLFGTDEENGSEDLEIYRSTHELPPMVFTPDGSFPVINIEKGMIRADILHSASGNSPIVESVVGRVRISEQQNRRSYRARRNEKSQPSPEPSLLHYTMHHDCKRNRAKRQTNQNCADISRQHVPCIHYSTCLLSISSAAFRPLSVSPPSIMRASSCFLPSWSSGTIRV